VTPERWIRIREVFEEAVERTVEGDRTAYLKAACSGDAELRREVETLLISHEKSPHFMATPAAYVSDALMATEGFGAAEEEVPEYPQGYRLGSYELERLIGRGGMGSVWLAKRFDNEFNKKVAIKLVRRGMDSQEILRRFRRERQLLANLDHPNIALLIDGGSTPEGLPYLVMEYVEGTPIDQYCEDHKTAISERLHLFRSVCSAVQYAHQNLVVHRDIKAGNILVTADGVPKLLDFGIAKLLPGPNSAIEPHTRSDLRPMTLDYASPEQVRGEPVNTATDVYSMGVLLFKLLTGRMVFESGGSRAALEHAICEVEPPKPSAVALASGNGSIPDATHKMAVETESMEAARKRLRKRLAGDLDNIVLMALRKEQHRRYASVEQFSDDVQRYLDGRPVIARLDTPGYQLARFVTRNAEGVAAAVVVAAALISIAAVSSHYAGVAFESRVEAENRETATRRELAQTAGELGLAQRASGDYSAAYTNLNRAIELAQELYSAETASGGRAKVTTTMALAQANASMGELLLETGPVAAARVRLARARDLYRELLTDGSADQKATLAVAEVNKKIAAVDSTPSSEPPPH